jgi:hypothetical protein
MNRPLWGDVAQYTEARQRADELMMRIARAGFHVAETVNGYSVSTPVSDQRLTRAEAQLIAGRQIAIYTVTADGQFRWGWVEHADGQGRTDFHDDFDQYLTALNDSSYGRHS